jgi:hypothetical protein
LAINNKYRSSFNQRKLDLQSKGILRRVSENDDSLTPTEEDASRSLFILSVSIPIDPATVPSERPTVIVTLDDANEDILAIAMDRPLLEGLLMLPVSIDVLGIWSSNCTLIPGLSQCTGYVPSSLQQLITIVKRVPFPANKLHVCV